MTAFSVVKRLSCQSLGFAFLYWPFKIYSTSNAKVLLTVKRDQELPVVLKIQTNNIRIFYITSGYINLGSYVHFQGQWNACNVCGFHFCNQRFVDLLRFESSIMNIKQFYSGRNDSTCLNIQQKDWDASENCLNGAISFRDITICATILFMPKTVFMIFIS